MNPIFYGELSKPIWNWINRREGRLWLFLYRIGVWLQNIEWKIRHLK